MKTASYNTRREMLNDLRQSKNSDRKGRIDMTGVDTSQLMNKDGTGSSVFNHRSTTARMSGVFSSSAFERGDI